MREMQIEYTILSMDDESYQRTKLLSLDSIANSDGHYVVINESQIIHYIDLKEKTGARIKRYLCEGIQEIYNRLEDKEESERIAASLYIHSDLTEEQFHKLILEQDTEPRHYWKTDITHMEFDNIPIELLRTFTGGILFTGVKEMTLRQAWVLSNNTKELKEKHELDGHTVTQYVTEAVKESETHLTFGSLMNLNKITFVDMQDSLKEIKSISNFFKNCTELKEINGLDSFTNIQYMTEAFKGCGVEELRFNLNTNMLSMYEAFRDANRLRLIDFGDINTDNCNMSMAFAVKNPAQLKIINKRKFTGKINKLFRLDHVDYNELEKVADLSKLSNYAGAFEGLANKTEMTLFTELDNLNTSLTNTFSNSSIRKIVINNENCSIEQFSNLCSNSKVEEVYIRLRLNDDVIMISFIKAFENCKCLKKVTLDIKYKNNDKLPSINMDYFVNGSSIDELEVVSPLAVVSFDSACLNCKSLRRIISNNKNIEEGTYDLTNLHIDSAKGMTVAFANCEYLKKLILSSHRVPQYMSKAFLGTPLEVIESLDIKKKNTLKLVASALDKNIDYIPLMTHNMYSYSGITEDEYNIGIESTFQDTNIKSLTIDFSDTNLENFERLCSNCSKLKKVILKGNKNKLHIDGMFAYCVHLEDLTIDNLRIGSMKMTFSKCIRLKKINTDIDVLTLESIIHSAIDSYVFIKELEYNNAKELTSISTESLFDLENLPQSLKISLAKTLFTDSIEIVNRYIDNNKNSTTNKVKARITELLYNSYTLYSVLNMIKLLRNSRVKSELEEYKSSLIKPCDDYSNLDELDNITIYRGIDEILKSSRDFDKLRNLINQKKTEIIEHWYKEKSEIPYMIYDDEQLDYRLIKIKNKLLEVIQNEANEEVKSLDETVKMMNKQLRQEAKTAHMKAKRISTKDSSDLKLLARLLKHKVESALPSDYVKDIVVKEILKEEE